MRKLLIFILLCLFVTVAESQDVKPKRVHLTPAQVRYYESVTNEIESLPEVKTLRAKQQAFITGVAMAGGIDSAWRLVPDGKGSADIVADAKPEK